MPREIINPIISKNLPDPSIVVTEDGYRLVGTCSERDLPKVSYQTDNRCNVQMYKLDHNFRVVGSCFEAMPKRPSWARTDEIWAPHIVKHRDEYLMFFSVGPDRYNNESHCAVARSRNPDGPYTPDEKPLVSGISFKAIDIQAVFAKDGSLHATFGSGWASIKLRELLPDASGWTERSRFRTLLRAKPKIETSLIEGPEIIYSTETNQYILLVSGSNTWKPDKYLVKGFISDKLEGPYIGVGTLNNRHRNKVWIPSDKFDRVGHTTTFKDLTGRYYAIGLGVDRNNPNDENDNLNRMPVITPIEFIYNDIIINHGTSQTPEKLTIPTHPSRRLQYQ